MIRVELQSAIGYDSLFPVRSARSRKADICLVAFMKGTQQRTNERLLVIAPVITRSRWSQRGGGGRRVELLVDSSRRANRRKSSIIYGRALTTSRAAFRRNGPRPGPCPDLARVGGSVTLLSSAAIIAGIIHSSSRDQAAAADARRSVKSAASLLLLVLLLRLRRPAGSVSGDFIAEPRTARGSWARPLNVVAQNPTQCLVTAAPAMRRYTWPYCLITTLSSCQTYWLIYAAVCTIHTGCWNQLKTRGLRRNEFSGLPV